MYIFYSPATGHIDYTATGGCDLIAEQTNWIEVEEQELGDLSAWSVVNGQLAITNILPLRATVSAQINSTIGDIRKRFITPLPGQDMIYLRKESEAMKYLADSAPSLLNYPMIGNEIGITGSDAYEVAQIWLNMASQWMMVAGILENIRLGHLQGLGLAETAPEVAAVKLSFNNAVATFLASLG